ncbi:Fur family transcriptional regulator [Caloranaerobacter azorensis]|uniref:Fur family transcriptional regulator, ferric uptake regulator n=3 Tax=Caloranaerobacter azorensis TaxID=116090 RepID=A0A1M5RVP6_9FIRM|nr:Fur family transcriptional regulator [Caloranaerobacter azorensis]KGG81466.1 Fur family transcriptional regulator [Caloranaerobacter azorensis H53214]QIB26487.1 transcriptional repressor [Caloranaerobacter azorensis]SHH30108.1 Fur family transcriptional regulator, ferric uptake regulator [Caloranaerobacter azorensis DSM 13643]
MENLVESLKEQLKEKGYKLTTQRRIILDVILENQGKHLSPEEIYEKVRGKFPEIGLATVYRTLQLFEELNIIYKLNFNDGCSRYELNTNNGDHQHHHLICLNCGKVIEVQLDLLEALEEEIEKSREFKIVDHNLKFFGYCKDCKK